MGRHRLPTVGARGVCSCSIGSSLGGAWAAREQWPVGGARPRPDLAWALALAMASVLQGVVTKQRGGRGEEEDDLGRGFDERLYRSLESSWVY